MFCSVPNELLVEVVSILLHTGPILQKGLKLRAIKKWGPGFNISFDIQPTKNPGQGQPGIGHHKAIVVVKRESGGGIPEFFMASYPNVTLDVRMYWDNPAIMSHRWTKELNLNEWYHIELISNTNAADETITFNLKVNNTDVALVRGSPTFPARDYENVIWYPSPPNVWETVEEYANVKNLRYCLKEQECCEDL